MAQVQPAQRLCAVGSSRLLCASRSRSTVGSTRMGGMASKGGWEGGWRRRHSSTRPDQKRRNASTWQHAPAPDVQSGLRRVLVRSDLREGRLPRDSRTETEKERKAESYIQRTDTHGRQRTQRRTSRPGSAIGTRSRPDSSRSPGTSSIDVAFSSSDRSMMSASSMGAVSTGGARYGST